MVEMGLKRVADPGAVPTIQALPETNSSEVKKRPVQSADSKHLEVADRTKKQPRKTPLLDRAIPVVFKFTRRIAKEKVMNVRKDACKVSTSSIGLSADCTQENVKLFDHLTPQVQQLLADTRKLQTRNGLRCATCETGSRQSKTPCIHDCRLNWEGSSKAMEADVCVHLVKSCGEINAVVSVFVGEDDSSTISKVRKIVEHEVAKWSDVVHGKRSFGSSLYSIKTQNKSLTDMLIQYFQRCFGYALKQNKDDEEDNNAEILQIETTHGKDELSIYIKPSNVILPETSAVNKLAFQRGILFYDRKPITDAVAIDVALKTFIEWLKSRMPCILVAHNYKSFDARFLVQEAEKNGVMDDLVKTVSCFTDSLSAFRELLPERKSHSQENLVQDLMCKSYEARNALADV
ncbi:hypothetical protein AWC38_SpisGene24239 [Stylophora pistillata]|uniref:Mutator-like transposase domain-containing protein n=1 Tax=Stylophora pistillata TaxID=50429 RepID=A0A2B4R2N8_STYPI|nr:hypothetical protein AWC38_SpisGene24239 [Stylophora pistillata]